MGGVIRVALTAHGARARRWTVAAALAVIVSGILLGGLHLGLGTGLQESASDFLFAGHGTRPAASTVIVGIDQRSHQTLMARHGPLAQWQRMHRPPRDAARRDWSRSAPEASSCA